MSNYLCSSKLAITSVLSFIAISTISLGDAFPDSSSLIPMEYGRMPSSDLIYDGQILTSDEAHELVVKSNYQFDLSSLDPSEKTDIWKDIEPQPIDDELDNLPIKSGDVISNPKLKDTMYGLARFTADRNVNGVNKPFQFILGKKVHNFLLHKAILRKLGYKLPALNYLETVRLSFESPLKKEIFMNEFLEELGKSTFGNPNRWVVENDPESNEVVLQDLLVRNTKYEIIDLSTGMIRPTDIMGKRILRSTLLPFSLVHTEESINLFSWSVGRTINKHVLLPYEFSSFSNFYPTFDDAKWMANRISKLDREDFREIVEQGHFPKSVELVLTEKIISRRNSLMRLLNLDHDELKFDPKISYGDNLKEGKIIHNDDKWPGYASRFSYGDPESPLSSSELFAYAKSQALSTVLSNSISKLNKLLPTTDLSKAIFDHQRKLAKDSFKKFLKTGKVESTPLGLWIVPAFGMNLIASREIVTGPHMGTDNLVQLADTIGISVNAGVFVGVDGIAAPWSVSGNVGANLIRRYTHIKPIFSMKKALKEPIKNLLVPWFKKGLANEVKNIVIVEKQLDKLIEEVESIEKLDQEIQNDVLIKFVDLGINPPKIIALEISKGLDSEIIRSQYLSKVLTKEIVNKIIDESVITSELNGLTIAQAKDLAFNSELNNEEIIELIGFDLDIKRYSKEILIDQDDVFNTIFEDDLFIRINEMKEQQEDKRKELLSDFKEHLEVGESIIITDSVGANAGIKAGATFYSAGATKILASINANLLVLNRLHILRKDENTIHIYKDIGHAASIGINAAIRNRIPILTISAKRRKGKAKTKYFSLSLDERDPKVNIIENLTALESVLRTNSLEKIGAIKDPFYVKHKFSERDFNLSFLVWGFRSLKQKDYITVENNKGDAKNFFIRTKGKSSTRNYQKFLIETVNGILDDYAIPTSNSENAAGTIGGKAKNKILSIEGEVTDDDHLISLFAKHSWEWKGWSLKEKKALKLMHKLTNKFNFEFFPDTFLNDTKKIQLYNITVHALIYERGLNVMINNPYDISKEIFLRSLEGESCSMFDSFSRSREDSPRCAFAGLFFNSQRKYLKLMKKNKWDKASKYLLKMLEVAESVLDFSDYVSLIGGKDNIYVYSKVAGFLVGDERGDDADGGHNHKPFLSSSMGEFGSDETYGPIRKMRNFLGMTDSEFFAFWIKERIR